MSLILALIICLGVWFFMIAPFLRLWRVSRQWRDLYNTAAGNDRRNSRQQRQPRPRKKKKIDPSVGEYVEFTETTAATGTQTGTEGSTTEIHTETESQITDVTWEDLPPRK